MSPTTPEMQRRVAQVIEAFQIDHGIALPLLRRGLAGRVLASLLRMQPPNGDGKPVDSFLVPYQTNAKNQRINTSGSMSYAIRLCKQRHPEREFTCRTVEGGIRCWRTK